MKKITLLFCLLFTVLTSCVTLRSADGETMPFDDQPEVFEDAQFLATTLDTDATMDGVTSIEYPDPWAGVEIDFLAVGDNMIHSLIYLDAETRGTADKKHDFLPLYENVAPIIAEADVAFINQETVMAGEKYGYTAWPTFNSPQQLGKDLVTLGFDVVNVATNHILDKGESGYRDTLDFWHTQPITMLGGYYNKEDHSNIRVTEVQGVKIAWLSYTYGTNYIFLPEGSEMFVPYIDDALILSDLAKAESIADVTIVSMHWGPVEYTITPEAEHKRLAKLIADNGAEVILGHHSHCLRPIEWIETEHGRTLCVYSLGNFVSGHTSQITPLTLVGGMFTFTIETDGDGGLRVVDPLLTPTVMYYDWNKANTKLYLLENYTQQIASSHGIYNPSISGAGMTPEDAKKVVKSCISDEFLPDYMK